MSVLSPEGFKRKLKNFGATPTNVTSLNDYPLIKFYDPGMDLERIWKWLENKFGDNWIWSNNINTGSVKIWFKNEDDALLFKLSVDLTRGVDDDE
jgi:hypothetical protein